MKGERPLALDCLVAGCRWGDSDDPRCECPGLLPRRGAVSEEVGPLPRKPYIKVGRFLFYLWSGGWDWRPMRLDCGHCRNLYVGPFGFEWLTEEWDDPTLTE